MRQIGNDLAGSLSGVDVPKVAFLLDDLILQEGIVYAYSAFWRSDTPVRFQIWRLACAEEGCKTFALVDEIRVIPSVIKQREDVSILLIYIILFGRVQKVLPCGIPVLALTEVSNPMKATPA